jgi:hypothetical protein
MSVTKRTYAKEKVVIMGAASECIFDECPSVTVMGTASHCMFNNVSKITIMKGCDNSSIMTAGSITIMKMADTVMFENCKDISVLGGTVNCTRDGNPFEAEKATPVNIVQGGTVIRGVNFKGGVFQSSQGNRVGGTTRMQGPGTKYLDGLEIPGSMGFGIIEKRRDGIVYGSKDNGATWYVYNASRGKASDNAAWVKETFTECQLCGSPADKQEKGTFRDFCSTDCQKKFYKK